MLDLMLDLMSGRKAGLFLLGEVGRKVRMAPEKTGTQ